MPFPPADHFHPISARVAAPRPPALHAPAPLQHAPRRCRPFAAQGLAVTRDLGLPDDSPRVNPDGGAIALGHPLGMSGARLVLTAVHQLEKTGGRLGLAAMCVGVGQGLALVVERV